MNRIAVIGAGSFGTTLAQLLSSEAEVLLYGRDAALIATMQKQRENTKYLSGIPLSVSIHYTSRWEEALAYTETMVIAVPLKGLRQTFSKLPQEKKVLLTSKGIENETFQTAFEIAAQFLPQENIAVLSGPNLAREIAAGKPCASVIASPSLSLATAFQKRLSGKVVRIYLSADTQGVCLGGALKNVYAIGAGIAASLSLGMNAIASYICRALAEIKRLFTAFGTDPETVSGLSGLGDLICTCLSPLSRNFTVGAKLAEGKSWEEIEEEMVQVAEGVYTAQALHQYARTQAIDLPIADFVYRILHEQAEPHQAILSLLERPLKASEQ